MLVTKRNGKIAKFSEKKIKSAISKAAQDVGEMNKKEIDSLTSEITNQLKDKDKVNVEEIQDLVEATLVKHNLYKISKAFILWRQKRGEARTLAASLGIQNDLKLPTNSFIVLSKRYLLKDEKGRVKETPSQLFRRVSKEIAIVDEKYGKTPKEVKRLSAEFFHMMVEGYFLPNSPTLMNAGGPLGLLSACFVLPIEDSIDSIFEALHHAAKIFQSGGGLGYNFSNLRPSGDIVKTTGGVASGAPSFMKIYNAATQEIKQGGKRRGANMGILNCTHPDLLDFITMKGRGALENFNISVGVTDKFMNSIEKNEHVSLINPRNKEVTQTLPAKAIWDLIITEAWRNGDPGLIFLDTINRSISNPIKKLGPIEASNPCGELPLYSYESCNLGSINLSKFVKDNGKRKTFDWEHFKQIVSLSVHFLDNVIDANKYPIPQIEEMSKRTRRIGLGIMGWADLLLKLEIPYNSKEALDIGKEVMKFLTEVGRETSVKLGEERGDFPEFKESIWIKKYPHMRNSAISCIAPTGTISILAGCSSGIEPLFSIITIRNLEESLGTNLVSINPYFESLAIKGGFYSEELIDKISRSYSIQDIKEIPEDIRKIFVTAHDIDPAWHVQMQAAFQKYTDNAVSKTVNLPNNATPYDVEQAFLLAWKLGCKGITIFRSGSKEKQVFTICPECSIDE